MVQCDVSDFSHEVSRIAVAQVCETVGFEGFNESALDSLADTVIRYVCKLGRTAKFYANLSGRTQCNVFDIIQGLEDLGLSQSYSGASENNDCVTGSSGIVREIKEYVDSGEEVPFAQPVSGYPVPRVSKPIPSFIQMAETPSSKHILAWLPAFPDHHTYVRTPVWNERVSDPRADKIELARQHRKAERSLLSLQKCLVGNEDAVVSTPEEPEVVINGVGIEKIGDLEARDSDELQKFDLPLKISNGKGAKKKSSLLETFAPAIEAMVDGLDSGSDNERILPPKEKRPSLFLEFKSGKRVFGEPLDLRIRNKAPGKPASWFGREDERDDKKRRVEYILRQAMENQQEISQL